MFNFTISSQAEGAVHIWADVWRTISLFLTGLALYLLFFHTPKANSTFRWYIFAAVMVNLLSDAQHTLYFRSIPLFPIPGFLCDGALCKLGLCRLGVIVHAEAMCLLAALGNCCFLYRHRCVEDKDSRLMLSKRNFITIQIASVFVLSVPAVLMALFDSHNADDFVKLYPNFDWVTKRTDQFYAFNIDSNPVLFTSFCATAIIEIMLAVFPICLMCARIFFVLSHHVSTMSARTRAFHRQACVGLTVQIAAPAILIGIPSSIFVFSIYTEAISNDAVLFFWCFEMLHSSSHSLVVIAITPSYRSVVGRLLARPLAGLRQSTVGEPSQVTVVHLNSLKSSMKKKHSAPANLAVY